MNIKQTFSLRLFRSWLQHSWRRRVLHPDPVLPEPVQQPEEEGPRRRGDGEQTQTGCPRRVPPSDTASGQGAELDLILLLQHKNRKCETIIKQSLYVLQVNHASDVWVLGKEEPESYDAMVTDQRGVVIAAPGADCMPVLFADPVSKVIGAAHAGTGFIYLFIYPQRI